MKNLLLITAFTFVSNLAAAQNEEICWLPEGCIEDPVEGLYIAVIDSITSDYSEVLLPGTFAFYENALGTFLVDYVNAKNYSCELDSVVMPFGLPAPVNPYDMDWICIDDADEIYTVAFEKDSIITPF